MTVFNSKKYKFQLRVTIINKPRKKKQMEVFVDGTLSEKKHIKAIARELESFIMKEL
jgi:hypothetical protein